MQGIMLGREIRGATAASTITAARSSTSITNTSPIACSSGGAGTG